MDDAPMPEMAESRSPRHNCGRDDASGIWRQVLSIVDLAPGRHRPIARHDLYRRTACGAPAPRRSGHRNGGAERGGDPGCRMGIAEVSPMGSEYVAGLVLATLGAGSAASLKAAQLARRADLPLAVSMVVVLQLA